MENLCSIWASWKTNAAFGHLGKPMQHLCKLISNRIIWASSQLNYPTYAAYIGLRQMFADGKAKSLVSSPAFSLVKRRQHYYYYYFNLFCVP